MSEQTNEVEERLAEINSYGLTAPTKPYWKTFEIDGFQLVVSCDENEEEDGVWDLILQTAPEEHGMIEVKVKCNVESVVRNLFDGYDEETARQGLQFVFDNLIKALAGDGYELKVPAWVEGLRGH